MKKKPHEKSEIYLFGNQSENSKIKKIPTQNGKKNNSKIQRLKN